MYRTSPANFYGVGDIEVHTGTLTSSPSDSGSSCHLVGTSWLDGGLGSPIYSFPPQSETIPFLTAQELNILFDQDFNSKLLSRIKQFNSAPFDVASCSFVNGEGAPQVHVPMQALTDHQTETVTVKGVLNTPLTPLPAITTATPAPRPSSVPPQTSVTQPAESIQRPPASPSQPAAPSQPSALSLHKVSLHLLDLSLSLSLRYPHNCLQERRCPCRLSS
jgi:hypothetical protein